jgi:hypothetical protein
MGVTTTSAVSASTSGSAVVCGSSELDRSELGTCSVVDIVGGATISVELGSRVFTRLVEVMDELFTKREKLFSVSIF